MHRDLEGGLDVFARMYDARTALVPVRTDQVCKSDRLLGQTYIEARAAKGEASGVHAML